MIELNENESELHHLWRVCAFPWKYVGTMDRHQGTSLRVWKFDF